jgi:divalent metal cation (Fe/Co/Zn/Cd) transporter
MAEVEHHDNHGQTPAAWTAVTIIGIGFLVGCVAVVLLNWPLLAASVGIVVLGVVVGKVMQMMGMGKPVSDPQSASQL